MANYKKVSLCDERKCFANKKGKCSILLEVISPDCPFFKTEEQHRKDVKEALRKWQNA